MFDTIRLISKSAKTPAERYLEHLDAIRLGLKARTATNLISSTGRGCDITL